MIQALNPQPGGLDKMNQNGIDLVYSLQATMLLDVVFVVF